MGSGVCFALTAVHLALAWIIVFSLKIGPVIATVDASAGRGVHAGDLLAVPLACLALALGAVGIQGGGARHQQAANGLVRASL